MAEHPHIKTRFTQYRPQDMRDARQRSINPAVGDTVAAKERQNARDGSRMLLARLCMYHAKHARWGDARQYWARRAKEASFGS